MFSTGSHLTFGPQVVALTLLWDCGNLGRTTKETGLLGDRHGGLQPGPLIWPELPAFRQLMLCNQPRHLLGVCHKPFSPPCLPCQDRLQPLNHEPEESLPPLICLLQAFDLRNGKGNQDSYIKLLIFKMGEETDLSFHQKALTMIILEGRNIATSQGRRDAATLCGGRDAAALWGDKDTITP